ncbi:hypothetical protein [Ruegeria atlantica]|uniref:hypothetical protein n=1 Tax=Ruegeria atlantica TaxID=81569 RepID=UPI00147D8614|nr:hypothetical protein [Ruegeria atlantica]
MKALLCVYSAIFALSCWMLALILVFRHPIVSLAFSEPDQIAEGPLLKGLRVAVQSVPFPNSYGDGTHRRVAVCDGVLFCSSLNLIADLARKTNLYRHKSGAIIFVNSIWMIEVQPGPRLRIFTLAEEERARLKSSPWDCSQKGPLANPLLPKSLYFKDMEFLGAYSWDASKRRPMHGLIYDGWDFLPSTDHGEELCRYPSRG